MHRNSHGDIKVYCDEYNEDDLTASSARDIMLIVLAELVLIASIRRINYVVTLAIIDVLITCLRQLG